MLFQDTFLPDEFTISNIYPNPFNPITRIRYSLPENTNVQISVYNILGQRTEYLVNNFQTAGYHSVSWNANSYASGVYFISMAAGTFRKTRKVLMIK